jgi:hypothetical protein
MRPEPGQGSGHFLFPKEMPMFSFLLTALEKADFMQRDMWAQ